MKPLFLLNDVFDSFQFGKYLYKNTVAFAGHTTMADASAKLWFTLIELDWRLVHAYDYRKCSHEDWSIYLDGYKLWKGFEVWVELIETCALKADPRGKAGKTSQLTSKFGCQFVQHLFFNRNHDFNAALTSYSDCQDPSDRRALGVYGFPDVKHTSSCVDDFLHTIDNWVDSSKKFVRNDWRLPDHQFGVPTTLDDVISKYISWAKALYIERPTRPRGRIPKGSTLSNVGGT